MADRTWNAVDARLYDEDWNEVSILVMGMILAKCPNQYGVYKLPLGFIKRFLRAVLRGDAMTIDAALDELESEHAIQRYREGRVVWIIKKWGRDPYSKMKNNRDGALKSISENFPDVYPDFERRYPLVATESTLSTDGVPTSDADSDSDAEAEIPKKIHKTVKSEDLPGWCFTLVKELFPDIKLILADPQTGTYEIHPDVHPQVITVEQLHRLDKYSQEDIEQVLKWAKSDTGSGDWPGWSAQFLSCAPLRKKKDGVSKFAKMKASYEASLHKHDGPKEIKFV